MKYFAYCWASGEVGVCTIQDKLPEGVLVFARGDSLVAITDSIAETCVFRDRGFYVPGLEAVATGNQIAGARYLAEFGAKCKELEHEGVEYL